MAGYEYDALLNSWKYIFTKKKVEIYAEELNEIIASELLKVNASVYVLCSLFSMAVVT